MGDSSGNLTKSFSIFFSQVTSFEALMISLASFVLSFFLAAPIGFFTHLKKMFEEPGEFDHISFCIETFPPAWRVSTTILGSFVGVPTQRSTRWCPLCTFVGNATQLPRPSTSSQLGCWIAVIVVDILALIVQGEYSKSSLKPTHNYCAYCCLQYVLRIQVMSTLGQIRLCT